MTSSKTKDRRLKDSSLRRAKLLSGIDTRDTSIVPPPGSVPADQHELRHNNTYDALPQFYVDKVLLCRTCGKEEVWTAEQQKWWYEVAKGNINSQAVQCRECRDQEKARRDLARNVHKDGLPGKNKKS
ncbi:MAG: hypothetical protein EG826_15310 [Deltaproteobacteria bacterium]|nr:hypothetical protein [Deltaproteobacteria bacterium]